MKQSFVGLFVAEGTSDLPLADLVESLFVDRGVSVRLSKPDFAMLRENVRRDVGSKLAAGLKLMAEPADLVVVHRDADNAGVQARRTEIAEAARRSCGSSAVLPVIPVRMTEAWLLLDESTIRQVAGNPRGRAALGLPTPAEAERIADPKHLLSECLLKAAGMTGRRHTQAVKRFPQHRRQLLALLDRSGPVAKLASWQRLTADVEETIDQWRSEG